MHLSESDKSSPKYFPLFNEKHNPNFLFCSGVQCPAVLNFLGTANILRQAGI
jgi:hypothetical protein